MRVHFSTDDLPPRDREEFFVELIAKYVMNMTSGDRRTLLAIGRNLTRASLRGSRYSSITPPTRPDGGPLQISAEAGAIRSDSSGSQANAFLAPPPPLPRPRKFGLPRAISL